MTNTVINAEKVNLSVVEKSTNLLLGLDFNLSIKGIHHAKIGARYTLPLAYSTKKLRVEERSKRVFTINKRFEVPITDNRLSGSRLDNFQSFGNMFWVHLSYNWAL
jgi:hypothetical protein